MKSYCFTASLLGAVIVFVTNCGTQTNTKVDQPANGNNVGPISSEAKAAPPERKILWDFRKPETAEPPKFSKAETKAVAKYVLGENAVPDIEITSRVSGSFTKPGAKETLYYLSGCEHDGQFTEDCAHVEWNTAGRIAIYDGSAPVMKINENLGGYIAAVTDVNGDGVNEILSFGGYSGNGMTSTGAGLGQISGKTYKDIKGFNGYWDNCAIGEIDVEKKAAAAVISYVPATDGKTPAFTGSYFQGVCGDDDRVGDDPKWKKITQKEFDAFFDGNS